MNPRLLVSHAAHRRARVLITSHLLALAAALLGAAVLGGWWVDVSALMRTPSGMATVTPSTALAVVLGAGSCLLGRSSAPRWQRLAAGGLAAVVLVVGLGMLAEYVFGADVSIDHALSPSSSSRSAPVRTAPATAVEFVLLAAALLSEDAPRRVPGMARQILALAAISVLAPTLLGHFYDVPSLYRVAEHLPTAPHAALPLLLLGAAVLASRPALWLARMATEDSVAAATVRRLAPAALIIPLVVGRLRLLGERAGLYGTAAGTVLFAITLATIFVGIICWHAVTLARSEEALLKQADLLEQSHDAIVVRELGGRIAYWNRGAERLYGWPSFEAVSRTKHDLLHARRPVDMTEIDTILAQRGRWEGELGHTTRDGMEIVVESRQSVVQYGRGPALILETNREITARKEAERARRESAQRLQAIVQNAVDGIITIDERGIVESFNPRAERLFGYAAAEVIGQSVEMLMPAPYRGEHAGYLSRYLRTGERRVIGIGREVTGCRKDGSVFPMDLAVAEVVLDDGRRIFTGTVRDITDRKRAEAERELLLEGERAARAEAERAARMKDEFVATVSHELRTPLNAIVGWGGMLKRGTLDAAATARGIEVVDRNARALTTMIEDLLDVSRIVSGKLSLNAKNVDLARVCDDAIATLQPVADAKGVRLEKALDARVDAVHGDPGRLQQVVWNLLSNAIKFTPADGRVRIELRRVARGTEVVMSDTGAGIDPAFLPYVFERFRQADASTARKHGGLGLGLAIVRHIVELHGGAVRADSAGGGKGATFTVSLPVAATRAQESERPTSAGVVSLRGVRVLLVDDEEDARDMMRRMLEEHGAEVTAVDSAAAALDELPRERPDVLLSDIGMPQQDGYQLLRAVRVLGAEHGGETPAAAVTAFARAEDRELALGAGYQAHVPKPVDPIDLISVVAKLSGKAVE